MSCLKDELNCAVRSGELKKVRELFSKKRGGNNKSFTKESKFKLLNTAISYQRVKILKFLLDEGLHKVINASSSEVSSLLHKAVQTDNLEIVKLVLNNGAAYLEATNKLDNTPLHCAILKQNARVVELLLSKGADVHATAKSTKSSNSTVNSMSYAVQRGNLNVIKLLLDHGMNVNSKDGENETPLTRAVHVNRFRVVDFLLKNGADVDFDLSSKGYSPLHIAATNNRVNIVKKLLEQGALADFRSNNAERKTAMHLAVIKGHLEVVKLLLHYHADMCIYDRRSDYSYWDRDQRNYLPLDYAVAGGNNEMIEVLLNNEAVLQEPDDIVIFERCKVKAMHIAIRKGYLDIVELFLKRGVDIHQRVGCEEDTALHTAVKNVRYEIMELLLMKGGAQVDARGRHSKTPLHCLAQIFGTEEFMELLLSHGADLHARDEEDYTPLHYAVRWDAITAAYLLDKGAEIEARDVKLATPLHHSWLNRNSTIALLKRGADFNAEDIAGQTWLDRRTACMCEYSQMRYLVRYKGDRELSAKMKGIIKADVRMSKYYGECEKEMLNLRSTKIDGCDVAYYEVYDSEGHKLAMYAANEIIVEAFKYESLKLKFPLYAYIAAEHFLAGVKRQNLLRHVKCFFHLIAENNEKVVALLPETCIQLVLRCMSDKDLEILKLCVCK